jgi:multimeric flavodoxin WrbA
MKIKVAIVYHSMFGHTAQVAAELARHIQTSQSEAYLINADEAGSKADLLDAADAIIFGSPTYFGNVSAGFKAFMESTASTWFSQGWKDKLAAGFTNSSTTNGDKLNTLVSLSLFAAQHGMIWLSQGIMPEYEDGRQTDGQNRMASYLGLMVLSDNKHGELSPIHPGDKKTIELFAQRILNTVSRWRMARMCFSELNPN